MDKTTETLARYVTSLRYEDPGLRAVRETKRHLIDSLGTRSRSLPTPGVPSGP